MSLQQKSFLFIDCQTTGMHPSLGELLELSWCISSAGAETSEIKSRLLQVESLPNRVREVTGVTKSDLVTALVPDDVRKEFLEDVAGAEFEAAIIHYAQFEKAFLLDFLQAQELPFKVLCTHAISKRLIPNVPSRNIRALSGYFGSHFNEVKRAADHVRATLQIWKGLSLELEKNDIIEVTVLEDWLSNVKAKKSAKYEYNIDKEWRLALPKSPGIYRMFAKNGEILYVGKATSLRDRVNSYFRGMRGREKRKLEMMAQAYKIEVTECGSALEAALLESDEIKKHNPPYNVALKGGNKQLIYYSRDFSSKLDGIDDAHSIGPFRKFNAVDDLITVCRYQRDGDARGVFYDLLSPSELSEGLDEFVKRWPEAKTSQEIRHHLVLGFKILRNNRAELESEDVQLTVENPNSEEGLIKSDLDEALEPTLLSEALDADGSEADEPLTPEEVADKFERAYMRASNSLLRVRRMTRLLNCEVRWQEDKVWKSIKVADGKVCTELLNYPAKPHTYFSTRSWQGLGIIDYDRMSVFDSALQKVSHKFE